MVWRANLWHIEETEGFLADLRAIDGDTGLLVGQLADSVYHALRRDPHKGWALGEGLWVIRRQHLAPLGLLVTYYYRIHPEPPTARRYVEMVAAKVVSKL